MGSCLSGDACAVLHTFWQYSLRRARKRVFCSYFSSSPHERGAPPSGSGKYSCSSCCRMLFDSPVHSRRCEEAPFTAAAGCGSTRLFTAGGVKRRRSQLLPDVVRLACSQPEV